MKGKVAFILGILVGAALASWSADAQVAPTAARVTWTNATTDVNGNSLPASGPGALTQTRIQRSLNCTASSFGTVAQTLNVTPDVLSVLFENLEPGTHCFRARHISRDAANVEQLSDWSATVSKLISAPIGRARPPVITIE